ncbi:DNA-binding protein [Bacillus pseudomycoides]|uniref:DNA-binding protein n=1 Tax=Bacillus pseudomycoides TaxID=64104 RepID=UPI00210006C4|nr:DNA-binding protein [Bacillus pseudomycoides]
MNEFGVFAKEVAIHLEINVNTLRRWSLELEKAGYSFTRNEKEQRIYYKRDLVVLTDFQRLLGKTQSLENTAKAVVSKVKEENNAEKMLSVFVEKGDNIVFTKEELEVLIQKTADESAKRTANILFEKFNDSIERRDRELMFQIKQQQEIKQQQLLELAISKEKTSFFSRLFKKR